MRLKRVVYLSLKQPFLSIILYEIKGMESMSDQEIREMFKHLAKLYELDFETARTLFIKILNVIYQEEE